jgi:C_GCAxxG_C_C family probable redox protein
MKDLIRKYRNKDFYNLNCAEAILYSGNEYFQLGLKEECMKMVAGFGGGIFEKHLCGIVSGAVCVLSYLFKGKTIEGNNLLEIAVNDFKFEFRNLYDRIECSYLKEKFYSSETGCNDIIFKSAEVLQKIGDKYLSM